MSMMVLPNPNGVKIYNVSIGKSLPQWISEKKKRSLKKDVEYRRRLELIQDLEFPNASQRIKISPNGEFLAAVGTYKPQLKMFELNQLSMKFERHLDNEVVQFEFLSDDYSKLVFLRADRTIEFHAQYGNHYQLRIPKFGRDMIYHSPSCDLVVCGASSEVYRLNLEQGQFLNPMNTQLPGINCCSMNSLQSLYVFGGEDGCIECFDPRSHKRVSSKDITLDLPDLNQIVAEAGRNVEVTAVKFDSDMLTLAVGTSTGQTLLYDIRSPNPLLIKDHQYGYPIKSIQFLPEKRVGTADRKILKIWEREEKGRVYCSVEPPADINDVCYVGTSGLIFMAAEQSKCMSYFIPSLGPAPKWCSFLENLTEEMEEDQQGIYEDYKFVTKEELERLGATKLIGTEYLKAYMHGWWMDMKLYSKLRSIADPFEYDQYRKQKIKEKLEEQTANRIAAKRKMPKVNAKVATRLLEEKPDIGNSILSDPRFKEMWEKKDFEVDEMSDKFKLLHPTQKKIDESKIEEHFEKVESDPSSASEDEDDSDDEDEDDDEEEGATSEKPKKKSDKQSKKKVDFYELKSGHEKAFAQNRNLSKEMKIPFSKRVSQIVETNEDKKIPEGPLQLQFVPNQEKRAKRKATEMREQWKSRLESRRSVKELALPKIKLKKPRNNS